VLDCYPTTMLCQENALRLPFSFLLFSRSSSSVLTSTIGFFSPTPLVLLLDCLLRFSRSNLASSSSRSAISACLFSLASFALVSSISSSSSSSSSSDESEMTEGEVWRRGEAAATGDLGGAAGGVRC
jgi:hypothetical protein